MSYTVKEKARLAMESLLDSCELVSGYSGGKKVEEAYTAYFAPETMWYNRVYIHAAEKETLEATVSAVAAGVREGKLPPLISWLSTEVSSKDIRPFVKAEGYINPLPVQEAMFLDLEDYTPAAPTATVEHVSADKVGEWADTIAAAFGKPTERDGMVLIAADEHCDFLVHYEEGKMVAGMLLICVGDNAGVHEVATMEACRGKGIASSLMNCAMAIAKEKGCKYATLQASPMGAPLYEKLGFEAVGEVHTWLVPPPGMVL